MEKAMQEQGFCSYDIKAQMLCFDRTGFALLGHKQLLRSQLLEICFAQDKVALERSLDSLLEEGQAFSENYRFSSGGEYRLFSLCMSRLGTNAVGSIALAEKADFVAAAYVEELREQQAHMLEMETELSFYEDSVVSSPISFAVLQNRCVCYTAPSAAAQYGVTVGDTVEQLLPRSDDWKKLEEDIRSQGMVNWRTVQLRGKHERECSVRIYVRNGMYQGNQALLVWFVSADQISISDEEIQLALDIAQRNAKAKSAYIADMGHEVRTPLDAIFGLCAMLRKSGLNETQRDYIEKLDSAAHALFRSCNNIIDFAKSETGKSDETRTHFQLSEVLMSLHTIVATEASDKSLRYEVQCGTDSERILVGNPMQLNQLLLNLLRNAIQFTHRGGVTLTVSEQQDSGDEITLRFCVSDTGVGMSASQIQQLFDPLTLTDSAANRKYGATGLGLMISKELARSLGGELQCESQVDEGTQFWFTATFACSDVMDAQDLEPDAFATAEDFYDDSDTEQNAKIHILVAEDMDVNRMIINEILSNKGYRAVFAVNGEEAVAKLQEEPFDIIFMDIRMPGMDGLEATREIRRMPEYAETPIIAMTAHATPMDRERSLKSGMNSHITKPIEAELVYKAIRHWLRKKA